MFLCAFGSLYRSLCRLVFSVSWCLIAFFLNCPTICGFVTKSLYHFCISNLNPSIFILLFIFISFSQWPPPNSNNLSLMTTILWSHLKILLRKWPPVNNGPESGRCTHVWLYSSWSLGLVTGLNLTFFRCSDFLRILLPTLRSFGKLDLTPTCVTSSTSKQKRIFFKIWSQSYKKLFS